MRSSSAAAAPVKRRAPARVLPGFNITLGFTITYLSLILGELVPKQLALREPEKLAILVARPLAALARITAPMVWLLGASSALVLRFFGPAPTSDLSVTEEEVKAVVAEGGLDHGHRRVAVRSFREGAYQFAREIPRRHPFLPFCRKLPPIGGLAILKAFPI
mgnify:CR=1 FL=1